MKKFRALIALAIALNFYAASADGGTDSGVEGFSPKGRAAYQKLLAADIFRVGGVGESGETSREELALYV